METPRDDNDIGNSTDEEGTEDIIHVDDHGSTTSGPTVPKRARSVRTKPFSNPVHEYFTDDGENSKCTICSATKSGKHGTNLKSHLKSHHPTEYQEVLKREEALKAEASKKRSEPRKEAGLPTQTINDCFKKMAERKDGLKKGSTEYEKAVRSIALAFVSNSLPYRLIEDSSMKHMLATVSDGRLINLPRRQELSERISALTEELRSSLKSALQKATYISLTLDLWSRPGYSSAMMGVTCHFFDQQLNRIMRGLLACRTINQPHTGENIHELYNIIRCEWGLDENRILRVVTDNGSNVVCAFKDCLLTLHEQRTAPSDGEGTATNGIDQSNPAAIDFRLEIEEEEDATDEEEVEFDTNEADIDDQFLRKQRISCFAHNMMLAVKKAVDRPKQVKKVKSKVHSLIAKFSKSPKATEMLRQKTGGLGLVKPVLTRWIYWFYVFDRLIKIKREVSEVCEELGIIHELGPMDWEIVKQIKQILEPFAAAVTRLEGDSYATISEVYPMVFSLKVGLVERQQQPFHSSVLRVIKKLIANIDHRFKRIMDPANKDFDPIYVLATLLDPRYGLLLDGELLDIAKRELYLMICTQRALNNNDQSIGTANAAGTLEMPKSSGLFAAAFLKINQKRQSGSAGSIDSAVDQEMETYTIFLKSPDSDTSMNDPFVFWSKKAERLPQMYCIAVNVLSVPATSAPSERAFSRASYILDRKRHNLDDKKLEAELMYKLNLGVFRR